MTLLALAQRWPPATWRSRLGPGALPGRPAAGDGRSLGRPADVIGSRGRPRGLPRPAARPTGRSRRRSCRSRALTRSRATRRTWIALVDAGFRMMSPTHFFDNAFGGSAHGSTKGGLTAARARADRPDGAPLDARRRGPRLGRTIDDVLAIASRPVIASHTGVRRRRRLDPQPGRRPASAGSPRPAGSSGSASGRRPAAGTTPAAIARSIVAAVGLAGVDARRPRVGLRRRGPGAVRRDRDGPAHRRASSPRGSPTTRSAAIMGANALRVLRATPPAG